MGISMLYRAIGNLCRTGNDHTVYKLSSCWPFRSASLPTFGEASGEWVYIHFVLDVGEMMRLPFMCFVTVSTLLRYDSVWFHLTL